MVKVKIGTVEYTVSPIPPRLAPHNALYSELLQRKAATTEEAEEIGKTIGELSTILLKATVQPMPVEEHYIMLFNAVTEVTNRALSQSFFPAAPK